MRGKFQPKQSWEKQSVYLLDNGYSVTTDFSPFYGESISRIDFPNKQYWHASNGLDGTCGGRLQGNPLPDFAKPWVEIINNEHGPIASLVRCRFEKVYESFEQENKCPCCNSPLQDDVCQNPECES